MSNDPAERGATFGGEIASGFFLVRRLPQANFHEFVARKGVVEGFQNRFGDSPFAYEDDRPELVREAPEMAPLPSGESRRRGFFR